MQEKIFIVMGSVFAAYLDSSHSRFLTWHYLKLLIQISRIISCSDCHVDFAVIKMDVPVCSILFYKNNPKLILQFLYSLNYV